MDPIAEIMSDPESHLSDVLYLYFRIYKRRVLWDFMQRALKQLQLKSDETLYIADIGASMGHDVLYLLNMLTDKFKKPLPLNKVICSLVEGDAQLIERGQASLAEAVKSEQVEIKYFLHPFVEGIPLQSASQHIVLCSEVVEHLEHPEKLLAEIFRILKPGGMLLFTTDNSPSFPQRLARIPTVLNGTYSAKYQRPDKDSEIITTLNWNDKEYPVYGHINLNPTRFWEKLSQQAGFTISSFGTYQSIRRGGGSQSPLSLSFYFFVGALVFYLLPRRLGRFWGDTTALLLSKPR